MSYVSERPIEMLQRVNYWGYVGMKDKEFFVVGRRSFIENPDNLEHIADKILSFYNLTLSNLRTKSRVKTKVRAKYMAYYIMFTYFNVSKSEIARLFGFDHTTIINGISCIRTQISLKNNTHANELRIILRSLNK